MNYELFQHQEKQKNIFLVNMTKELDYHFAELTKKGIEKYLKQGKTIGILVNKKGFSRGVICHKCGHIPQCKKCSVPISYHKMPNGEMMGLCHICKIQYLPILNCPICHSKEIKEFGMGIQKVAEYIQQEYHITPNIITSENVGSPTKTKKVISQWKENAPQITLGTGLLSTPIKSQIFDLIIFLNADIGLNIPDYNAAEKNFYFLYSTFTKHKTQNFIVQSLNPDHHSIRYACKMDKNGFFEIENEFRKTNAYPPFADICLILYKNETEEALHNKVDQVYKELLYLKEKYQTKDLEIYSTPPLVYKMFGKYRYNIIIKGNECRNFMDIVYTKLNLQAKGFKIDRMADSIV